MGHIFDNIYVSLRSSGALGDGGGQYWSVQSDGTISACKKEIDQRCCFVLRPGATVSSRQFIFIQPFIINRDYYVCPSGDGILGDRGQISPSADACLFLVRKNAL